MAILSLVLFACAGLLIVVSLSSLYATNVTVRKGHNSPWALYLGIAAFVVAVFALLFGL